MIHPPNIRRKKELAAARQAKRRLKKKKNEDIVREFIKRSNTRPYVVWTYIENSDGTRKFLGFRDDPLLEWASRKKAYTPLRVTKEGIERFRKFFQL